MRITFVKKVLSNGSPCAKCIDVIGKLEASGQIALIHEILIADENDPSSPGMLLAKKLDVHRAPFFVVETEDGEAPMVYTVYLKFAKEILGKLRPIP